MCSGVSRETLWEQHGLTWLVDDINSESATAKRGADENREETSAEGTALSSDVDGVW